jgi:hypothetical protein
MTTPINVRKESMFIDTLNRVMIDCISETV